MSFSSSFESEVAAAEALLEIATGAGGERLALPVPRRIVQLAADLARERGPRLPQRMTERLAELRGEDFESVGYAACAMAALLMRLDRSADLDLSRLCLQGPPHEFASPVLGEIQGYLQGALVELMQPRIQDLLRRLDEATAAGRSSCYRDDPTLWRITRTWAYDLPIRPTLERYALELSPLRSWRYEDVLDVSVTGASTVLLAENDDAVRRAVRRAAVDPDEALADIWDGLNDGCWDQVTADREEYVDAFSVVPSFTGVLSLRGSSLQRARFGSVALDGWDLSGCELLLADMRSCTSVRGARFDGGNWWSVMLNPADRYHLSPGEEAPGFQEWCAAPPWVNPYYSGSWPHPFGVPHAVTGR